MSSDKEDVSVPMPPAWIKEGAPVWYASSPGKEHTYAGTVGGTPWLLGGHTWVVRLCKMEPRYRKGQRSYVPAAACSALTQRVLSTLNDEMVKALKCLYLVVQEEIADDVRDKVLARVAELEFEAARPLPDLRDPNEWVAELLDRLPSLVGFDDEEIDGLREWVVDIQKQARGLT